MKTFVYGCYSDNDWNKNNILRILENESSTLWKLYFLQVYQIIRENGGVCIADEVQSGLGRTGKHMWAFQQFGVVPDIVTVRCLSRNLILSDHIFHIYKLWLVCLGQWRVRGCNNGLRVRLGYRSGKVKKTIRLYFFI